MDDYVGQELKPLTDFLLQILVGRGLERPINKHGTPNHVFLWDESPVPAVVTHIAVVAHAEITVGRNYEVITFDMLLHNQLPFRGDAVEIRGWYGGEIVAIGIVTIFCFVDDVRFIQFLAIAIDHAVAQVKAVSGNTHDPLDHIQPWFCRRKKDYDISTSYFPIRKQRTSPMRSRRELHTVHKNVVTDQQCVLHGTGGNLEGLHDEGDNEQAGHQNG